MTRSVKTDIRLRILFCAVVFGAAALSILTFQSDSKTSQAAESSALRTESHHEGLENYDIRTDKKAFEKLARFRQSLKKSAAETADEREKFVRGEQKLKSRVPSLKVEYSPDLRAPEVITPDVKLGRAFLTEASNKKRPEILRDFVKEYSDLLGATVEQTSQLEVIADYTNPDGNLSFAHLEQKIGGIPVFRGEIKAGFNRNGQIVRVINNFAPGLEYDSLSNDFRDPAEAVKAAYRHIDVEPANLNLKRNEAVSDDLKTVFGSGDWATSAEKMYFPTEPGVAVPAWRVLIWQPVNAYYVIVDAETGTMLWRKNITEDQTQAATYNVYANPNAFINVADNPAPMTPGPVSPAPGTQGTMISRTNVTLIGNEAPYAFNNLGWITDGTNGSNGHTDGNNVEAGLDRSAPDGVDAPVAGANRVFDSGSWNPPPGNPAPGDNPLTVPAQNGAVIQMFYVMNRFHDEMYRLGWTESAFNFQNNNFGRGGLGGDRVSAQGQDYSGSNNANFSTPSDGNRGRMQMYIWTGPTPNYDGTADAEIIIHEAAHGLSNRLHGNASGLTTTMARGMGEGWSDFYGHSMLSEPTDPLNGVYTTGGYATFNATPGFNGNYYYGIRRFPKAIMSSTGGANNRPHNPLTFADLDSTQANISDGAFARGPFGSSNFDQVHNAGEIWSSALWEVRALMIQRLGWAVGNRRVLQLVTDGMKLSPLAPTFLQSRDAIIAAAQASLPAPQANQDVADIWEGFRIRGMGFSASIENPGSGPNTTRVTEAFDAPNLQQLPELSFSDSDGDGFPEPGEKLTLTIPLQNNTGLNAENTILQISGGESVSYGTILNNSSASKAISYTVPSGLACGSAVTVSFTVNSSLGSFVFSRRITLGVPNQTFSENFDSVSAPNLPSGWTAESISGGRIFVTSASNADTAPNSAFAVDPTTVGGGTNLTSPPIAIAAPAATLSFRNNYHTESGWDGGVLEISINGGAFADILTAGGSFVQNGYNSLLGEGTNNPLSNRKAWTGNSEGYVTTIVRLPESAAGKNVQFRWRFGADDNTAEVGWHIDTINVVRDFACSVSNAPVRSRADFDGDGKTDLSVFRPSEGVWYLNRSASGFTAMQFGLSDDKLVPGDYDGDGKTDTAVRRNGDWFVLKSSDSTLLALNWGLGSDVSAAADYDGDGKTDFGVFRPSNGVWYILKSDGGTIITQFGQSGDLTVPADYDGDGKTDLAVYRAGIWYLLQTTAGFAAVSFGLPSDNPVPADFDGDNRDDIAVFRPSNGVWYWLKSGSGGQFAAVQFGQNGDVPVPGDYDGDGRDDPAVYRSGIWYMLQSTSGFAGAGFGTPTDRAVPKAYIP